MVLMFIMRIAPMFLYYLASCFATFFLCLVNFTSSFNKHEVYFFLEINLTVNYLRGLNVFHINHFSFNYA